MEPYETPAQLAFRIKSMLLHGHDGAAIELLTSITEKAAKWDVQAVKLTTPDVAG